MRILLITTITLSLSTTLALSKPEDSVENAFKLCAILDSTGLLSEPCSVSGWNSSVDIKIDTNGTQARKMCSGLHNAAKSKGLAFDDRWKVRIYSPFSGKNTLAQCKI